MENLTELTIPSFFFKCCHGILTKTNRLWTKSVDGNFLVPEILSVFQGFQNKFETVFDEVRTELRSFSKEKRDKIEHLESRKYHTAQKKKLE